LEPESACRPLFYNSCLVLTLRGERGGKGGRERRNVARLHTYLLYLRREGNGGKGEKRNELLQKTRISKLFSSLLNPRRGREKGRKMGCLRVDDDFPSKTCFLHLNYLPFYKVEGREGKEGKGVKCGDPMARSAWFLCASSGEGGKRKRQNSHRAASAREKKKGEKRAPARALLFRKRRGKGEKLQ